DRQKLLGFRDITNATNERTSVAALIPRSGVGHTMPLVASEGDTVLSAVLSSFVFDFVARQKLGGTHMTYTVLKQLPVLTMGHSSGSAPTSAGWPRWVRERAEELSGIGQDSLSYSLTRRKVLRSELDALFFILYGVGRADLEYIMESFPIVKRKDIAEYG